jgi:hypothetical protein
LPGASSERTGSSLSVKRCSFSSLIRCQTRASVPARVAPSQGHVFATLAQEALRAVKAEFVDQRLLQAGQALAAPEHTTEVGLVLQDELDDCRLPAGRRCRGLVGAVRSSGITSFGSLRR